MSEVTTLSEQKAKLSPVQRALLEKWTRGEFTIEQSTIPRRSKQGPAPLSFAQQRLWFIDQLIPGSPAYNLPAAFRLTGRLNVTALAQSLDEIVRRHEVLRTTFPSADGQPSQVVAPSLTLPLPVVDLQEYPETKREAQTLRLIATEEQRPFDLARGPLLRAILLRLDEEEHVFQLTIHHIISDGWSSAILVRELTKLYEAFSDGKPSPLPELPIQYADFAHWQREWLEGERLKAQLAYWKKQLGNNPTVLELPADRPRPVIQNMQGARKTFALSPSLSRAVEVLSQEEGATVFTTLLAAFKALLLRYTGQSDILVGVPIANRNRREIEGLIGFFVNTLVLRTDLGGNPSFRELLGRVRETTLGAQANQDLPFEQLVEELQPERDLSRNPLFQAMFTHQNWSPPVVKLPSDLTISPLETSKRVALFDWWLGVWNEGDKLAGAVEYSTGLFDADTITRMVGHFETLLASAISNPEQRLSALTLLTATEQHQLLVEWNNTAIDYHCDAHLYELIEAQVEQTPDAIALIFQDQHLSYTALNACANQLAHHLQRLGVRPETLVGICMERSIEMVMSLLAALKIGGAYVPLDPTYPRERLAFMLADAQTPVLLTQQQLRDNLPQHTAQVVCVDSTWAAINQESKTNPHRKTISDLAYMIYTSGSTGKPKGVMNTHRGICNRLLWMQDAYHLTNTDRVLQKTPYSFDVSVWEFFWPLITGASLVVARPEGHKDSAYLVALIADQKITTLHFVPSMLQVFLEEKGLERCNSLRRVICSGEALSFALQERFFTFLSADLHNLYGPTEAAIDVTFWACQKESQQHIIPIGSPIANIQIYLLDRRLNPVPVGVPGELHIGGVGLARAYLGRPDLTGEKFIPDPFSIEPSARLYKTGDLARYLTNGNIEFLGRLDYQAKIRGVRIELGEIEAVLRQHPAVRDTVVMVRDAVHTPGHQQLVAYVIPNSQNQETAASTPDLDLTEEQLTEWQQVFDGTYDQTASLPDPTFNIAGWNSSYTGEPISEKEMRQWVDYTVERILSMRPRRVLEIGCGTGLLLFRIAPHCQQYWGTDFSAVALSYVQEQLTRPGQELPQVKLFQRTADDFDGLQDETFDLVILNSVVQYFPGIEYLLRVLRSAVKVVAPGGTIFVGDVRSLPLLEVFHTSVELERAAPSLTTVQLQQRAWKCMSQDQELVIDPAFFFALQQELPQISHAQTHLKRGRYHNEVTRFRYDVILHVKQQIQPIGDLVWLDWQAEKLTLDAIRRILTETEPKLLGVTHVPNARLQKEARTLALLTRPNRPETVEDLQQSCQKIEPDGAIEPEDWWALSQELPYTVDVCWLDSSADGSYETLLRRRSKSQKASLAAVAAWPQEIGERQPWQSYANNPLQGKLANQLIPRLRRYLKEKLSEYMIPSVFVFMNAWPLTPSGKLDRRALPAPLQAAPEMEEDFVAPRTPVEKILAGVWSQVLGLEQVGVNNNFFELGGDSIHSIRVVARAKQAGVQLTPQHIFQHQTIAELAEVVSFTPVFEAERAPATPPSLYSLDLRPDFSLAGLDEQKLDRLLGAGRHLVQDVYPLTPMQHKMLAEYLRVESPVLYFLDLVLYFPKGSKFNAPAFERAWQSIIDRHPALRTSFAWEGLDEPLQIVHKRASVSLEQYDWRGLSLAEQREQLQTYIQAARERGFELTAVPHTRLALFQTDEDEHLFYWACNYMLQDGWSSPLIRGELFASYELFRRGQEPGSEHPQPFRDHIAWLRQQDMTAAETFWRKMLEGFTAPTPLLANGVPNKLPVQGSKFIRANWDEQMFRLSAPTIKALRSLARQHHITASTLMQGTWALLLSHYSRQQDIVFGVVVSGRSADLAGIETMVGQFGNFLPLRLQAPPNTRLLPWLKEIQTLQAEMRQYEYTPLTQIHRWSQIPDDLPLFQSYLVVENFPGAKEMASSGRAAGPASSLISDELSSSFGTRTAYPLRVEVWPEPNMTVYLSYYQCFFDHATIARMLQDFKTVLEGILRDPAQCRLGELQRLIASE